MVERLTGALRGVVAGLVAGVVWWGVEWAAGWALGGTVSASALRTILALDLACGAAGGAIVGLVTGGRNAAVLALGLTAVYGFLRVYEPPGMAAEALFVVLAVAAGFVGLRIAASRGFLHLTVLTVAAIAFGKAG